MARSDARPQAAWAEAACLLAGVLAPLAFHTLGTVGFEATKAAVVRVLALVLALGWLARRDPRTLARLGRPPTLADLREAVPPALRPLALALLAVVLSLALSAALSIQPGVSVLGSWDRVQGVVTALAWVVLGLAAAHAGRDPDRRRFVVTAWLLASVPVCFYAVAQRAGLDPVAWLNQPLGAASTLGTSTALATYLAMLLPLALARAVEAARATRAAPASAPPGAAERGAHRRRDRAAHDVSRRAPASRLAAWAGLFVLQAAALAATHVRGGLLGAAVGLTVALVALAWVLAPGRRGVASWLGLAVVAGAGGAIVGEALRGAPLDTDSTGQRLLIWRATLETVASGGWRALLGFGPETQAAALEGRFPLEIAARFEHLRFDRAHNVLLDALLTTGLLGLAASVALAVLVARAGLRALTGQGRRDAILTAGLLGGLAGQLAANSVAFDSVATGALGAMLAGLLVASSSRPAATPAAPARLGSSPAARAASPEVRLMPLARLRVTGWLATLAVGAALVPWLLAPLMADLYHTRALAFRAAEAPASSVVPELEAARWAPWQDVPLIATALAYVESARAATQATGPLPRSFDELQTSTPTSREGLFEAARLALERAVALNPRDPYTHAHLARLWATRAEATADSGARADRLARAIDAYDRAIERGPRRVHFYDEAGRALTLAGRSDEAIARFRQAEALDRPTAERWARIGDAERARGDADAARAAYRRALELDARSAPAEAGLAALAVEAGDFAGALPHAQRAARFQMRTWEYRRDLALILRDLGQREEALEEARAARRMAPAWETDALTGLIDSLR